MNVIIRKKQPPILSDWRTISNVQILPVLRYRLSFACLAARHILSALPGTVIAVDLPRWLDGHPWCSTALDALPKTSNLLLAEPDATYCIPVVPNDAAWLALHTARKRRFGFRCVDDDFPEPLPDFHGCMPDDTDLTSIRGYFEAAPPFGQGTACVAHRTARIAARLHELSRHAQHVLFICDWRIAQAVLDALRGTGELLPDSPTTFPAAIIPEDSTLLWQCGYLDDIPALTARMTELDNERGKLDLMKAVLGEASRGYGRNVRSTLQPALQLLEPAVQTFEEPGQTKLAARLLGYPEWSLSDLSEGKLPRLGVVEDGKLGALDEPFDLMDVFGCTPLYQTSSAERAAFAPPAELAIRKYWGPNATPLLTRRESAVGPTEDDRWTVPSSFIAMAEGARRMREAAQTIASGIQCDLFTPVCWCFRSDCDGDHRSVQDVNAAYRRLHQLSELYDDVPEADDGEEPDVFHTLSATRASHTSLCPGVCQDIACSLSIIYTGPENGPERYRAVSHLEPVPRLDPSEDLEIRGFPLVDRSLAFAIKNARGGVVLLARSDDCKLSPEIDDLARKRKVRIIQMPLTVMPRALARAIQRRIFISKNIRWSATGDRVGDRMVNWRVPLETNAARRTTPARRIRVDVPG